MLIILLRCNRRKECYNIVVPLIGGRIYHIITHARVNLKLKSSLKKKEPVRDESNHSCSRFYVSIEKIRCFQSDLNRRSPHY